MKVTILRRVRCGKLYEPGTTADLPDDIAEELAKLGAVELPKTKAGK